VKPGIEHRLELSVGLAMKLGGGLVLVAVVNGDETLIPHVLLPRLRISVPQLEPRSFSFNSSYGACPNATVSEPLRFRSCESDCRLVEAGARWSRGPGSSSQSLIRSIQLVVQAYGFDLSTPFEKFPIRFRTSCSTASRSAGPARE